MKILQISDFHFNDSVDFKKLYENKIQRLFESVQSKIDYNEEIIFCICGDLTDKADPKGYDYADQTFSRIRDLFSKYNHTFEFVPGNHDLINNSFKDYDQLISKYIEGDKYTYENECVIHRKYDDIELLLINSVCHKDYSYGLIDLDELRNKFQTSEKVILVTHHDIVSRYNDDSSPIRNSFDFIKAIGENDVSALLHGHTHGYSDLTIGEGCKVIGVGPIFKQINDVTNQFNLIGIENGSIINIDNFSYRSDLDRFDPINLYSRKNKNIYSGKTTSDLYSKFVSEVKSFGLLNNFHVNIQSSVKDFFSDIEENFSDQIPVAQQWLKDEVPKTMYYNHTLHMNKGEIDGLDYIIEELNRKATSSRAIIPLVNINEVINSEDNFLPSLDIFQFGFNTDEKNELFFTLYLRALEVNNFFKINICEVYLITKSLIEKFRSIKDINLTIFAFRAQYKEKFGCFQKAEIDSLDESDIMIMVMEQNISSLEQLLINKFSLFETVIIIDGVEKLLRCINKYNDRYDKNFYRSDLIEKIKLILDLFYKLKKLRRSTSIYQDIEIVEQKLKDEFPKLLEITKEMKKRL